MDLNNRGGHHLLSPEDAKKFGLMESNNWEHEFRKLCKDCATDIASQSNFEFHGISFISQLLQERTKEIIDSIPGQFTSDGDDWDNVDLTPVKQQLKDKYGTK